MSIFSGQNQGSGISNLGTLASDSGIPFAGTISKILSSILKGQNPDTHWEGWEALDRKNGIPLGTNAQVWVTRDGDNPKSEAINIIRWAERYGIETLVNYNSNLKTNVTLDMVRNKLSRNGFQNEANMLKGVSFMDGLFGNSNSQNSQNGFSQNSNSNIMEMLKKYFWIPLALIVVYMFKKKK